MKYKKGYTFRNSKVNIVAPIEKVPNLNSDIKPYSSNTISSTKSPFKTLFAIFLLLILAISLIRLTGGIGTGDPLTFTGFLEYLSTLNFNTVDFNLAHFVIDNNWGVFDFLRIAINFVGGVLEFSVDLVQILINVVIFLFNIAKWVFVA